MKTTTTSFFITRKNALQQACTRPISYLLLLAVSLIFFSSQTHAQAVPELMYFRFDVAGPTVPNEAAPATAVSASGTVNGASIGGSGQFNTALLGNGLSSTSNNFNAGWATNLSAPWTISVWFSGVTNALSSNYLFGGSGGSTFRALTGGGVVAGAGNLEIRGTGMTDVFANNVFDAAGTPVVITFVYDVTVPAILVYVNGVFNNSVAQPSTLTMTGTDFTIGNYATSTGLPSGGKIDEFRMYNRAVPASEIALTWNQPLPLNQTPCSGKPTAGVITPVTPCPSTNFNLAVTGSSTGANLVFQWQKSSNNSTWTNIASSNAAIITDNITTPTYYRAILTCTNSSQADTSAVYYVQVANFLGCYCTPVYANGGTTDNINIFQLRNLLNNSTAYGNPAPYYVNYTTQQPGTLPIPQLVKGAADTVFLTFNTDGSQYSGLWIDYNQNGLFETSEFFTTGNNPGASGTIGIPFVTPANAKIGITRLRVRGGDDSQPSSNQPCGASNSSFGEAEDYFVQVLYPPCNGPVNAGTAFSTDTLICSSYTFTVADTSHEHQQSSIVWNWQKSTNGGASYLDIASTTGVDSLINQSISSDTKYRMRMICLLSNDTTYSNVINMQLGAPYQCYCYSMATGGAAGDSSDIGSVTLGKFSLTTSGPHLGNPTAIRGRTDYTYTHGPVLYADSTYRLSVYQIMKGMNHADARISVFLDYNNNFQYDLQGYNGYSPELVYTGVTTAADWYIDTYIKIPHLVVPDVPTGLRVVLNNDVNPAAPANLGCGAYTSGETEDYIVIFKRGNEVGVPTNGNNLHEIAVYPNPTDGKFTLSFGATKAINQLDVVVSTITGQEIIQKTYRNAGTGMKTELDLSGQAKGIYFVTINGDGEKITRKLVVQ